MEPAPRVDFNDTATAFSGRTDKALKWEYQLFRLMNNPAATNVLTSLASLSIKMHLPVKWAIKKTVYEQFCGGETLEETKLVLSELERFGIGAIIDYGVEGKESEAEFERTKNELIHIIQFAAGKKNIPFISCKVTGLTAFATLEKLNSRVELTTAEQKEKDALYGRMFAIAGAAADAGIGLFVDAEESWIQDAIDDLTFELMRRFNKQKAVIFSTPQMYRHDRLAFSKRSLEDAVQHGYILGLKPVRGAYMDKERKRAQELGYQDPIQPDKAATDRDYDAVIQFSLDHIDKIALCAATHNENSSLLLANALNDRGIAHNHPHIWFSQLFGMSDQITYNLAKSGYNVAKYLPYGPVKDVIPYLIRRAQENKSVSGQMSRELSLIHKEIKRRGI
ncbi:MAG TPA: proline dehydrogenase family protein [Chitinophagales bacterium]|nr:proline dehydrogenase family protein [Chitinophagales bacterium]HNA58719.1 proline dehydrogenase family protein [Chitinophagales bacterium]HNF69741.1 proline dehydrogenase family protein [Chitinophagales bacterium]HNI53097.1 proline dehydrogenase family protein [Chitinophagales bacterium]HNJ88239.1 proline dehydrogenase family protein [Chitinophagales bacterium]